MICEQLTDIELNDIERRIVTAERALTHGGPLQSNVTLSADIARRLFDTAVGEGWQEKLDDAEGEAFDYRERLSETQNENESLTREIESMRKQLRGLLDGGDK